MQKSCNVQRICPREQSKCAYRGIRSWERRGEGLKDLLNLVLPVIERSGELFEVSEWPEFIPPSVVSPAAARAARYAFMNAHSPKSRTGRILSIQERRRHIAAEMRDRDFIDYARVDAGAVTRLRR